jgi:peptidyl-prolyl cis-trans isomerase C
VKTAIALALALSACNTPTTDQAPAGSTAVAGIPDPGEKVLSVNGTPIGLNELQLVFSKMRVPDDKLAEFAWTSGGKRFAEEYALAVVLHEKAVAEKLQDDPEVKKQLALAQRQVLASAMREKMAKAAVTDAAIAEYYEKNKVRFEKPEVHVRQIRVATEPEAQEILASLKGGGDFAALAKEKSKDPSAAKGGDMGWLHEKENPTFGDQALAAEKGAILGPIESKAGFHVVEVIEKRDKTPMEEVRPEAMAQLEHAEATRVIDELRKSLVLEWVREPSTEPMPGMPDMRNPHGAPRGSPSQLGIPTRPIRPGGPGGPVQMPPGTPGAAPAPAPAPPGGGAGH